MEKKTTAKLEETKEVLKAADTKVAAKAEEKKVEVKAAEKKETKAEVKVEETKAVAAKEPAKAKKTTKASAKKTVKEELKPEVFVQFQNNEAVVADVVEKAKAQFVAEGHRASSIKSLQVYLKPEEYAAYYVINEKVAGRVDLF